MINLRIIIALIQEIKINIRPLIGNTTSNTMEVIILLETFIHHPTIIILPRTFNHIHHNTVIMFQETSILIIIHPHTLRQVRQCRRRYQDNNRIDIINVAIYHFECKF